MKANYVEFVTNLPLSKIAAIFSEGVRRRPLKLKVIPFRPFVPNATRGAGETPDREFGTMFQFPGPDPMMGSVTLSCKSTLEGTRVILRSTGNLRGRGITNSLLRHLVKAYTDADPTIRTEERSGQI